MDTVFTVLRVVVSLGVVVGVLWFAQRKLGGTSARRAAKAALSVVGRTSVGPKASVAIVEMDGKRFLLGVTEHGVSVLHTAEAPAAAFAEQLTLAEEELPVVRTTGKPATRPAAVPSPALDFRPIDRSPLTAGFAGSILSPETWRRALATIRPPR